MFIQSPSPCLSSQALALPCHRNPCPLCHLEPLALPVIPSAARDLLPLLRLAASARDRLRRGLFSSIPASTERIPRRIAPRDDRLHRSLVTSLAPSPAAFRDSTLAFRISTSDIEREELGFAREEIP